MMKKIKKNYKQKKKVELSVLGGGHALNFIKPWFHNLMFVSVLYNKELIC